MAVSYPFFLSTEWVDYVEKLMKYRALRPNFFSMVGCRVEVVVVWVGFGVHGVLVRDVGSGMGDGGEEGGLWCG